jgi:hypothetical protein
VPSDPNECRGHALRTLLDATSCFDLFPWEPRLPESALEPLEAAGASR